MEQRQLRTEYLVGALSLLLLIHVYLVSANSSTPREGFISYDSILNWKSNSSNNFQFIFNAQETIDITKLTPRTHIRNAYLCRNQNACLTVNGTFIQSFKIRSSDDKHTTFVSNSSNKILNCNETIFSISHFCNSHWNPPTHFYRNRCYFSAELHSPIACPTVSANHQRPCYVYNDDGQLIDLTRWILSNGTSYEVDTSAFNTTIKKFNLNICNEAHDFCGPNVSSCLFNDAGHLETGYQNLTVIQYGGENYVNLISLGQYNRSCPENRVVTTVKFVCTKDPMISIKGPKLIEHDPCNNLIEWETIRACPVANISVPANSCKITNEPLKIEVDLKKVTNNITTFEVPDLDIEGKNMKMMVGICQGLKGSELKCQGRQTDSTSVCLLNSGVNNNETQANNSVIVGSMMGSLIYFDDNRVNLEYRTRSPCSIQVSHSFNVTKTLSTRVEFFCSKIDYTKPRYIGFHDCTHVLEWGSSSLCFELFADRLSDAIDFNKADPALARATPTPVNQSHTTTALSSEELKIDLDSKPKSGTERHNESLSDSETMIKSSSISNNQSEDIALNQTIEHSQQQQPPISISTKVAVLTGPQPPRMNNAHKMFMISLILMSLVAFVVVIFVLDKKTRLGIPLATLRRQARQAFQTQPVPYTRVDHFNDSLDL